MSDKSSVLERIRRLPVLIQAVLALASLCAGALLGYLMLRTPVLADERDMYLGFMMISFGACGVFLGCLINRLTDNGGN